MAASVVALLAAINAVESYVTDAQLLSLLILGKQIFDVVNRFFTGRPIA